MPRENLSRAKAHLSRLVRSALKGEEVLICKDGVPVVRLVPVRPHSGDDPCRVIDELTVKPKQDPVAPLLDEDWGVLGQ